MSVISCASLFLLNSFVPEITLERFAVCGSEGRKPFLKYKDVLSNCFYDVQLVRVQTGRVKLVKTTPGCLKLVPALVLLLTYHLVFPVMCS